MTEFQITIDCADADAMAEFWSIALDYVIEPPPAGFESWEIYLTSLQIDIPPPGSIAALVDPGEVGPRLLFVRVPERKRAKNRLHLDLRAGPGDADKQAMIDRLTAAGASQLRRVDERDGWWMVMTDPEGNEFCVT